MKKYCDVCETEFAEYKYENNDYCSRCLVKCLDSDFIINSYDVTHYNIEGEHLGTNSDLQEVAENIAKTLELKKIEN